MPEPIRLSKEDQILMAVNQIQSEVIETKAIAEQLCKNQDNQRKDNMKIIIALVGLMGTIIAQKIISTPWYVDLCVMICMFAGIFLTGSLIIFWRDYDHIQRFVRIIGGSLGLFSSISQMFIYEVGVDPAPIWFGFGVNILMIILMISLVWSGWRIKLHK